jgi:hypothetical protein
MVVKSRWHIEIQPTKNPHKMKVSVIGVGHVGSLVGFLVAMRGLASEIVLCARGF